MQGFCAETGGAITLFLADLARHPGLDDPYHHRRHRRRRRGAARLGGALGRGRQIVVAWVITMPMAGLIASATFWLAGLLT